MAIVTFIVAASLLPAGTRTLPLPGLAGAAAFGIPLALFAPVAIAIALATALAGGEPRLEAVASRPLPVLDAVLGVAVALLALIACGLVWLAVGSAFNVLALEAGRNAVGYVGLALLAYPLLGPRLAGLPPVIVAIGAPLLGFHADGSVRWWAWPVASARDELSWAFAFLLLAIGAAMTALIERSAPME